MKLAILAALWFSSLATAVPVAEEKRYLVTEVVMETATVTVTGTRRWGDWGWGRKPSPTASNAVSFISTSSIPPVTSTEASGSPQTTFSDPSADSSVLTSTVPATQPTSTGTSGSVSSYADPILRQHNLHRSNHSAPDLEWDDNLASIAQEIALSCQYAHNTQAGGGGYGQNIGAGVQDDEVDAMITNSMYNDEMMLYPGYGSEPNMDNFESWGHFSQIVWKATTRVGCFTQYCPGGLGGVGSNVTPYFTVCNYQPTGNFGGQYAENVLAPRGDPLVTL